MKKIFLSTIVLFAFSLAIIIFQISCNKDAIADMYYTLPIATIAKLGGVKPDGTSIKITSDGTISTNLGGSSATQENKLIYVKWGATEDETSIWTSNYDGSNEAKINITRPSGFVFGSEVLISPDHKTLFITMHTTVYPVDYRTFSCNLDGSNLKQIGVGNRTNAVAY